MNTQQHSYPSSDLSPFCANDQVYSSVAVTTVVQPHGLPEYGDLIDSIDHINTTVQWPISLIVIGLSPFEAGQFDIDEHISQIGTLGVSAKLHQCVRRCNGLAQREPDATTHMSQPTQPAHQLPVPAWSDSQTPGFATLYCLTNTEFAVLTRAAATPLAQLCEDILTTLDQPLYIGQIPVRTTANLGIARGHEYRGRANSFLTAARSALFSSRQTETIAPRYQTQKPTA